MDSNDTFMRRKFTSYENISTKICDEYIFDVQNYFSHTDRENEKNKENRKQQNLTN